MRVARVSAAIALFACSVHCSLLTETDGLTGGSAPRRPLVPSVDSGAGADLDAAGVALPDGSVGSDVPDAAYVGRPSYCAALAPQPLFCDDFDQFELDTHWDLVERTYGTVYDAFDEVVSAPRAMHASTFVSGPGARVDVIKGFPALAGKNLASRLTFDLRVDAADASITSDATVAAIELQDPSGKAFDLELHLSLAGGQLSGSLVAATHLNGSTSTTGNGLSSSPPYRAWTHVEIDMTYHRLLGSSARVVLDGQGVLATTLSVDPLSATPRALLGVIATASGSSPWSVRYDNVVFDAAAAP